ncbi:MAG: aspartate--tRNA(Asn) ligase [Candidatus Ventricola sp.]|nr:aspartate--tRNA(Asn) ligase [Candidatus Ventricola sp.]
MKTMSGKTQAQTGLDAVLAMEEGQKASVHGIVHTLRDLGDVRFMLLRMPQGALQCVLSGDGFAVREGDAVAAEGEVARDARAPGGAELHVTSLTVLSRAAEPMPVPIGKYKMNLSMDTDLALRFVTLRNLRKRAVFKIQEGVVRGFREALQREGFTEIHSPKIVAQNAEGGANLFRMEYFGRRAYLAQSPQFYKQAMVPVYERVFEIGPVFRAEKHNTQRHLNEYTSMDFEMGFIDSFEDIMQMETKVLQNIMAVLEADYAPQLRMLGVTLPKVDSIPAVRFDEAKRMVSEKYGRKIRDPFDLEPEEEQLISRLFAEDYGSEFVFVTHYPSKKRPFYAADDPEDPRYTLSFDLLFRGLEVTTGGQRIHDYGEQVNKLIRKGMDPEDFAGYLMIHKYGTCPHGGLGLGLERLTSKLVGENNVREACLFPRDQQRIEP